MSDNSVLPPPVMWAQRSNVVLLTINLEDCKDPEIKIESSAVYFKGTGGLDQKLYEVTIPLYKPIDIEKSKYLNRGRCIEFILTKAGSDESYWPTLTADKKKYHWLKCDFNKWRDEDDSGDEAMGGMGGGGAAGGGGGDFEEMMRQMGGLGGAGLGGLAGGGGVGGPNADKADFEDFGDEDSDDDIIPDLE